LTNTFISVITWYSKLVIITIDFTTYTRNKCHWITSIINWTLVTSSTVIRIYVECITIHLLESPNTCFTIYTAETFWEYYGRPGISLITLTEISTMTVVRTFSIIWAEWSIWCTKCNISTISITVVIIWNIIIFTRYIKSSIIW
jgi:hypothetical protein